MNQIKGSVTIFVSMCLGAFVLFVMTLTAIGIYYSEHVRFEGAYDIAMNSALGEYSINLLEEYGLLYIDSSYLGRRPSIENVNEHVKRYLSENTDYSLNEATGPWGSVDIKGCEITEFQTATSQDGQSMRYQAARYSTHNDLYEEYAEEINGVYEAGDLGILENPFDALGEWAGIMGEIAGMELPLKLNEETGEEEEVPVNNPADWAFGLAGNDVLYLAQVPMDIPGGYEIVPDDLVSSNHTNVVAMSQIEEVENDLFYGYLLEKLGYKDEIKEEHPLKLELEYVINGGNSDFSNLSGVTSRIFMARLADNTQLAKSDGALNAAAYELAAALEVCTLSPVFIEPVAKSIVYAVAFLETVSDIHTVMNGGKVPLHKEGLSFGVENLLSGELAYLGYGDGLTYRQFLLAMIMLMDEAELNYKVMDVMEIVIRSSSGNDYFSLDWCIERFRCQAVAVNSMAGSMTIDRVYGIF